MLLRQSGRATQNMVRQLSKWSENVFCPNVHVHYVHCTCKEIISLCQWLVQNHYTSSGNHINLHVHVNASKFTNTFIYMYIYIYMYCTCTCIVGTIHVTNLKIQMHLNLPFQQIKTAH